MISGGRWSQRAGASAGASGGSAPAPAITLKKKTLALLGTKTRRFFLSLFLSVSFPLSSTLTRLEVGLVLDLIEIVQRGAVVQLVKGDDLGEVLVGRGSERGRGEVSMG